MKALRWRGNVEADRCHSWAVGIGNVWPLNLISHHIHLTNKPELSLALSFVLLYILPLPFIFPFFHYFPNILSKPSEQLLIRHNGKSNYSFPTDDWWSQKHLFLCVSVTLLLIRRIEGNTCMNVLQCVYYMCSRSKIKKSSLSGSVHGGTDLKLICLYLFLITVIESLNRGRA